MSAEHNKDASVVPAAKLPPDEVVKEKTYHNRYPGSNFIDIEGRVHFFNGAGNLSTTSKNLQAALDQVANKSSSLIYTGNKPVINPADEQPVNDIQKRAAEVTAQLQRVKQAAVGG